MKNILQKNIEVSRKVRTAASNMDVMLIAFDSLVKSIGETAEEVLEAEGQSFGLFAYTREFETLQRLLSVEMEGLEDLAEKLEKEGEA